MLLGSLFGPIVDRIAKSLGGSWWAYLIAILVFAGYLVSSSQKDKKP